MAPSAFFSRFFGRHEGDRKEEDTIFESRDVQAADSAALELDALCGWGADVDSPTAETTRSRSSSASLGPPLNLLHSAAESPVFAKGRKVDPSQVLNPEYVEVFFGTCRRHCGPPLMTRDSIDLPSNFKRNESVFCPFSSILFENILQAWDPLFPQPTSDKRSLEATPSTINLTATPDPSWVSISPDPSLFSQEPPSPPSLPPPPSLPVPPAPQPETQPSRSASLPCNQDEAFERTFSMSWSRFRNLKKFYGNSVMKQRLTRSQWPMWVHATKAIEEETQKVSKKRTQSLDRHPKIVHDLPTPLDLQIVARRTTMVPIKAAPEEFPTPQETCPPAKMVQSAVVSEKALTLEASKPLLTTQVTSASEELPTTFGSVSGAESAAVLEEVLSSKPSETFVTTQLTSASEELQTSPSVITGAEPAAVLEKKPGSKASESFDATQVTPASAELQTPMESPASGRITTVPTMASKVKQSDVQQHVDSSVSLTEGSPSQLPVKELPTPPSSVSSSKVTEVPRRNSSLRTFDRTRTLSLDKLPTLRAAPPTSHVKGEVVTKSAQTGGLKTSDPYTKDDTIDAARADSPQPSEERREDAVETKQVPDSVLPSVKKEGVLPNATSKELQTRHALIKKPSTIVTEDSSKKLPSKGFSTPEAASRRAFVSKPSPTTEEEGLRPLPAKETPTPQASRPVAEEATVSKRSLVKKPSTTVKEDSPRELSSAELPTPHPSEKAVEDAPALKRALSSKSLTTFSKDDLVEPTQKELPTLKASTKVVENATTSKDALVKEPSTVTKEGTATEPTAEKLPTPKAQKTVVENVTASERAFVSKPSTTIGQDSPEKLLSKDLPTPQPSEKVAEDTVALKRALSSKSSSALMNNDLVGPVQKELPAPEASTTIVESVSASQRALIKKPSSTVIKEEKLSDLVAMELPTPKAEKRVVETAPAHKREYESNPSTVDRKDELTVLSSMKLPTPQALKNIVESAIDARKTVVSKPSVIEKGGERAKLTRNETSAKQASNNVPKKRVEDAMLSHSSKASASKEQYCATEPTQKEMVTTRENESVEEGGAKLEEVLVSRPHTEGDVVKPTYKGIPAQQTLRGMVTEAAGQERVSDTRVPTVSKNSNDVHPAHEKLPTPKVAEYVVEDTARLKRALTSEQSITSEGEFAELTQKKVPARRILGKVVDVAAGRSIAETSATKEAGITEPAKEEVPTPQPTTFKEREKSATQPQTLTGATIQLIEPNAASAPAPEKEKVDSARFSRKAEEVKMEQTEEELPTRAKGDTAIDSATGQAKAAKPRESSAPRRLGSIKDEGASVPQSEKSPPPELPNPKVDESTKKGGASTLRGDVPSKGSTRNRPAVMIPRLSRPVDETTKEAVKPSVPIGVPTMPFRSAYISTEPPPPPPQFMVPGLAPSDGGAPKTPEFLTLKLKRTGRLKEGKPIEYVGQGVTDAETAARASSRGLRSPSQKLRSGSSVTPKHKTSETIQRPPQPKPTPVPPSFRKHKDSTADQHSSTTSTSQSSFIPPSMAVSFSAPG